MHALRLALCATALVAAASIPATAAAHGGHGAATSIDIKQGDGPERVAPRQQPAARQPYLQSTSRWTEMLLKDDAVYLQMTDFGIKQVGAAQDAPKKDEGFLGNVVKAMALSGVKHMLDHSLALSLADVRTALVRDGEVIFVTCQGKETFNKVKINNEVQKFSPDAADAFVSEVKRRRAKLRACQG